MIGDRRRLRAAVAGVSVAAAVGALWLLLSWNGRINRLETSNARLEDASTSKDLGLEVLCRQVEAAGGVCAVRPPEPGRPEQPVPPPSAVPAAPVDYDRVVREAVARVRAMVRDGTPGKTGRAGPPPTAAQIEVAVRTVCSAGRCGPGQPAIAAAVSAYFAANPPPSGAPGQDGADGAAGADGAQGEKGEPGRGIASIEVADCRMTVTYTDGTTAGPFDVCAPSPSPSPTTTPPLLPLPGPS